MEIVVITTVFIWTYCATLVERITCFFKRLRFHEFTDSRVRQNWCGNFPRMDVKCLLRDLRALFRH